MPPFRIFGDNYTKRDYFVNLVTTFSSVIQVVRYFRKRSEKLLEFIDTEIKVNAQTIHIDRSRDLGQLEKSLAEHRVSIVVGGAGVGKTALVKEFLSSEKNQWIWYALQTRRFLGARHVEDAIGAGAKLRLQDFLNVHRDETDKLFIFDSAEALSDLEELDAFCELIAELVRNDWRIVFTTRPRYIIQLQSILGDFGMFDTETISLTPLTSDKLDVLAAQYHIVLPSSIKVKELLCTPYWLKEFLSFQQEQKPQQSLSQFRDRIWKNRIMNSRVQKAGIDEKRAQCFMIIALTRGKDGQFYIDGTGMDHGALSALCSDEILVKDEDTDSYFITHDFYEELALERHIRTTYNRKSDLPALLENIGLAFPMRRAFRAWLLERLEEGNTVLRSKLTSFLADSTISKRWREEMMLAILLSSNAEEHLQAFSSTLQDNEFVNLKWIIALMRTACKEFDPPHWLQGSQAQPEIQVLRMSFTKPVGSGWSYIIGYIYYEVDNESIRFQALPLLLDWVKKYEMGETTRQAGLMALQIYQKHIEKKPYYGRRTSEIEKQMTNVVLHSAAMIKKELEGFYRVFLNEKPERIDPLSKAILTEVGYNIIFIKHCPDLLELVANTFWWITEDEKSEEKRHIVWEQERRYGFSEECSWMYRYRHNELRQSPLFTYLRSSSAKAVMFLIKTVNRAVEYFANSEFRDRVETVQLQIADKTVEQYISMELWSMYRGHSVVPELMKLMHQELEEWLLRTVELADQKVAISWCISLLYLSKSASITAIVARSGSGCLNKHSPLFSGVLPC